MNKQIHILCSDRDIELANLFAAFLVKATTVNKEAIKVIKEEDSNKLIPTEDDHTILPLALVTAGFHESPYCMRNLGKYIALFGQSFYPIVFDPVDYNSLRGMLLGVQVDKFSKDTALTHLSDIINSSLDVTISVTKWEEEIANLKNEYLKIENELAQWKFRELERYESSRDIHQQFKDLIRKFNLGGHFGFEPYLYRLPLKNKNYLVVDICTNGYIRNNPTNIVENHKANIKNHSNNTETPPKALITLMKPKPGLPKKSQPKSIDTNLEYYRYIDCDDLDWREQLLEAIEEVISL